MDKHYFIIVNYNSGTDLIKCVESILYSDDITPYIVIVDNASRDGSLEECKARFPKFTYIYNTHNIGFAAAANIGTRYALERNAKTITFCNPDAVIDKKCAHILTSIVNTKKADIVSPIICKYNSPEHWFSGGKISFLKMHTIHKHSSKKQLSKSLISTNYITGCVMTVSASVFQKISLFDENFFLYYEDADFSLRARKAGFTLGIIPSAKAYHKELSEQTNPQKTYFLVLSGLIFFNKHTHGLSKLWFYIHLKLRKIKNYFDCKKNKPLSQQVHKAYEDFDKLK